MEGSGSVKADDGSSMFRLLSAAPRPRELTGSVDLIMHYGLREQYETFTKKSFPASIAESRYLRDIVGDTEIRKGEGMELGQLLQGSITNDSIEIQPFELEQLRRAFTLIENGPISLPEADRGLATISGKVKDEKDKEKKHKHKHKKKHKHKDKDKDKDKEKHKDKSKEKEHGKGENGEDKKKHKKKKRRHDGDEEEGDGHKHKKKKHKHSSSPNPDAAAAAAAAVKNR